MKATLPAPIPEIPVANLDDAIAFYRDRFGFTLDWGGSDLGLAGMSQNACRIFLANPEYRKQRATTGPILIWLNMESKAAVETLYQSWAAANAIVVSAPESKPWGLHEFTAADLDGNLLRVFYDFVTPLRTEGSR